MQKRSQTGGPLSPLLFVLAADLLQSILNEAMHNHLITYPLQANGRREFPVIQYADDTILIMQARIPQVLQLKNLLRYYHLFTGLKINFCKSVMVPINIEVPHMSVLAE